MAAIVPRHVPTRIKFMTSFVTQFLQGAPLASGARELREWTQNYAAGRLVGLAATFCAAPFVLLSPDSLRDGMPVLAAALGSNVIGLLTLRAASSAGRVLLATVLGMLFLGLGLIAALSPTLPAIAAAALAIDSIVAPGTKRGARFAATGMAAFAAALLFMPGFSAGPAQTVLAVALLPAAALTTLHLQMASLRRGTIAADDRAQAASSREQLMMVASDAAVFVAERSGHVVDTTERAPAILGISSEDVLGRGLVDRVLIADRPALLKAVSDAAIAGTASEITVRIAVAGMGATPEFARFGLHVRAAAGAPGRAVIRIAPAMPLADAPKPVVDRAALFASLSHEVRTPMNAILGFSELLANPALAPRDPVKVGEYATIIQNSARESFAVTTALVDLLRIETMPFAANDAIDAEEMIRTSLSEVSARAPSGTIDVAIRGALGTVMADQRALRMLLSALFDGLTTASGGRASIDCTLGQMGLRPTLDVLVTPHAGKTRNQRPAFLGVLRELCQRLARALDAELAIEPVAAGWRASLRFTVPGTVAILRSSPQQDMLPIVDGLRKSA